MSIITKYTIVFIAIELWSLASSSDPVIGPYKQLNPNGCGLSRLSADRIDDCFEWHDSLNSLTSISGGRDVTVGEAPWLVLINTWFMLKNGRAYYDDTCTGSIIAERWVLTAAHCVNSTRDLRYPRIVTVVSGYNITFDDVRNDLNYRDPNDWNETYVRNKYHIYKAEQIHVHDNYTGLRKRPFNETFNIPFWYHDIALLKLDRAIPSVSNTTDPTFLYENSICLPIESYDYITGDSIGVIAGHSTSGSWRRRPNGFQMGYRRIGAGLQSTLVMETHTMDRISICQGDSGGPIWRYTSGRAVIIGIASHSVEPYNPFQSSCFDGIAMYMRVERYVDWIMALTGLDTQHLHETGHSKQFVDVNNELANLDLGPCNTMWDCNE